MIFTDNVVFGRKIIIYRAFYNFGIDSQILKDIFKRILNKQRHLNGSIQENWNVDL